MAGSSFLTGSAGPSTGPVHWTEPAELAPLRAGAALPSSPALRALGGVLAKLHATVPLGMRDAPRPWVLDPTRREAGPVLDALLARPSVAAAIDRATAAWEPLAVVHGDATIDSAIGQARPDGRWTVRLVGFEHAGLGSPAWDVVTAVDSIEVTGVLAGLDTALAVADLLAGYQPDRRVWASWQPYRIARAVQTAVTLAGECHPDADVLIARAAGLAQPAPTGAR